MRSWRTLAVGVALGIAIVALVDRAPLVRSAQAQHLGRLQNVEFDFDTTGQVSTLTFFDRDTGDIYVYVASTAGRFAFARRLSLKELGGPLAAQATQRLRDVPQLPTGIE